MDDDGQARIASTSKETTYIAYTVNARVHVS
jgi:hypothetical protein